MTNIAVTSTCANTASSLPKILVPASDLGRQDWQEWRQHLPQLDGLALVPCGAGSKGKAPIDPTTGRPLDGWQEMAFTPKEIIEMGSVVTCVGVRPGPDSDHLAILDIDGGTAKQVCEEHGCSFDESIGWSIHRSTSTERLKVAFSIPKAYRHLFADHHGNPIGKAVLTTKQVVYAVGKDGKRITVEPAEQIELFIGAGQCIVLGDHAESGGYYYWQGTPAEIIEPTAQWWSVITKILSHRRSENQEKTNAYPIETLVHSGPSSPCPVCGRDHSGACTTFTDGERLRVNCFHGQSFAPPTNLKQGEVLRIADRHWAFCKEFTNSAIGDYSAFVEHQISAKTCTTVQPASSAVPKKKIYKGFANSKYEIKRASGGVCADVGKITWRLPGFAATGLTTIAAEPGIGKTILLYHAAEAIQEGGLFLDAVPATQGRVLVVQGDEPETIARRKMARMGLKANFDILYAPGAIDLDFLLDVINSSAYTCIIVDSLTTVLATADCNTLDQSMVDKLYTLNKVATAKDVLVLMTAHLNKPAKDGSGRRRERTQITWADISGLATLSAAVNDCWGLTKAGDVFSLHCLGKRHVEAGTEWILERDAEDFWWGLKSVTDGLLPLEVLDAKQRILANLRQDSAMTASDVAAMLDLNVEYARRCLWDLYDDKKLDRVPSPPSGRGRPCIRYCLI